MNFPLRRLLLALIIFGGVAELSLPATEPALPATDLRGQIRDLNTPRAMPVYKTKAEWLARADWLRQHILVSCGLWPAPEKCPLNARIFGRIERDGYSVEKVCFESWPGFYVCGNLYRPLGRGKGPFPVIINPHGHWKEGRLVNEELGSIPGRCINFTRQGYVAFSWDMVGYNDSKAFVPHSWPPTAGPESLWGLSLMGLQLWNSIRAIDFVQTLPDVDPDRIACTGASGGGTQTFMLAAVDERVKFSVPVVMVSAIMQGGCLCENAPNLRQEICNVEISALAAPRPQLIVAASGDWTRRTLTDEFPAVRSIYKLFGAADRVEAVRQEAPHNYNLVSREAVYAFFGHWILGDRELSHFKETPFTVEPAENLLVWHGIEKPANALDTNGVWQLWVANSDKQLASGGLQIWVANADKQITATDSKQFRARYEPALRHALGLELPDPKRILVEDCGGGMLAFGRPGAEDRVPARCWLPAKKRSKLTASLVIHPQGWSAAAPFAAKLVEQGELVLAIDCFNHGRKNDDRMFTTYNKTDTQLRVQDILTALAYLRSREDVGEINLVGLEESGLWSLLARPFAPFVKRTVADVAQFNAASDEAYLKRLNVPVLRRAGDFRAALKLIGDAPLLIHNGGGVFKVSESVRKEKAPEAELVVWLTAK